MPKVRKRGVQSHLAGGQQPPEDLLAAVVLPGLCLLQHCPRGKATHIYLARLAQRRALKLTTDMPRASQRTVCFCKAHF